MDEILEELRKQTKILQSIESRLEGNVIKKQYFTADELKGGARKSCNDSCDNYKPLFMDYEETVPRGVPQVSLGGSQVTGIS